MISLNGCSLTYDCIDAVAQRQHKVVLDERARRKMMKSLKWVNEASQRDDAVYGVNTGFGSLARVRIPSHQAAQLSMNLIRSHAAGLGPVADEWVTRAVILLRANALSKGVSGCRPALVELLIELLNRNVLPAIPMQGSCGSSGDLAPLAHLGLLLIGDPEGEAVIDGQNIPADQALKLAGLEPIQLQAKDGLAITNGAQLSAAISAYNIIQSRKLITAAEIAAAMSSEALLAASRAFHPAVHQQRPYAGAILTARNLRRMWKGSSLIDSMKDKVQDAYSIRCTPQVIGAVRDTYEFVRNQVEVELNSATDNPIILIDPDENDALPDPYPSNRAYSAGLFHGEPLGMAMDTLKIGLCELASLSERRLYRLTTGSLSQLLPPGLVGLDRPQIGLMVPQTTAAALVSENKALAWPCSVDSIPTCEDQEDHIAMSTVAARRTRAVLENTSRVIAIELISASHALDVRLQNSDRSTGAGVHAAHSTIRSLLMDSAQCQRQTIGEQIESVSKAVLGGRLLETDTIRAVFDNEPKGHSS